MSYIVMVEDQSLSAQAIQAITSLLKPIQAEANGICVPCPAGKLCNTPGIVNTFGHRKANECSKGKIHGP